MANISHTNYIGGNSMEVVAVRKDDNGTITQYKLNDGQIIDHEQAVDMAGGGELDGCNITTARNGLKSIRSNPDGDPSNNLDNLPIF